MPALSLPRHHRQRARRSCCAAPAARRPASTGTSAVAPPSFRCACSLRVVLVRQAAQAIRAVRADGGLAHARRLLPDPQVGRQSRRIGIVPHERHARAHRGRIAVRLAHAADQRARSERAPRRRDRTASRETRRPARRSAYASPRSPRSSSGGVTRLMPSVSSIGWSTSTRCAPGAMLSIRKRPSESVIARRVVPSTEMRAPTSGSPWRLSIATPCRYPVVGGAAGSDGGLGGRSLDRGARSGALRRERDGEQERSKGGSGETWQTHGGNIGRDPRSTHESAARVPP